MMPINHSTATEIKIILDFLLKALSPNHLCFLYYNTW
jgi:hypothetical protein